MDNADMDTAKGERLMGTRPRRILRYPMGLRQMGVRPMTIPGRGKTKKGPRLMGGARPNGLMPTRGTRPREPIQRGPIPKGPALWRPRPESDKVKGAKAQRTKAEGDEAKRLRPIVSKLRGRDRLGRGRWGRGRWGQSLWVPGRWVQGRWSQDR